MIQIQSITFAYPGGPPVLDDLSLTLGRGEHLAIMGPNGSGKTTLARCLNGLLVPQRGTVRVEGLVTSQPDQLAELRAMVGMVFQNPDDQLVATSVETEIAFGMENLGVPRPAMRERVDAALREFGLEAYRTYPPHQLSGGEKQRVAVAAAMVLRPAYLVLDEPTTLLDPNSKQHVLALLYELPERYGTTLIHITQSPDQAARADRIIVMHRGRIHADAPPEVVFAEPGALEDIGLGLPFPVALLQALRRLGVEVAQDVGAASAVELLREQLGPPIQVSPCAPHCPHSVPASIKLSTEDLAHTYNRGLPTQQPALDGVTMEVPKRSVVGLLGVSGSGKTTLAQHLNGLLKPQRGRVLLDGADIWQQPLPRIRQRVGLVFQFPELQLFAETVAADVAYGPRNLGWTEQRVAAAVQQALDAVGLPVAEFGARPPLTLSGGQRRRAALAGILAMEPEVLVLDEPTAGLDPGTARFMLRIFTGLVQAGKSLILITHDMDLVAALADRVVVLDTGRVLLAGETRTVLSDPDFSSRSGLEAPTALRFARVLSPRGDSPAAAMAPMTLDELAEALARRWTGASSHQQADPGE